MPKSQPELLKNLLQYSVIGPKVEKNNNDTSIENKTQVKTGQIMDKHSITLMAKILQDLLI
jgi:hypothetical protein